MLSWPVAAQGSGPLHMGSEVTASLGDQLSTSALAEPEYHKLKTDGVSATVTVLRTGRAYPAGGSAFAQIKLANTGPSKRVAAELVFEAESAVIRGVSGDAVKVREDGNRRIAMVDRIAKGKPRMVIVEVRLSDEESLNKLNVTLRQPGGTGETVTLGWSVTNCASGFYSQIVKVREGSGAGIAGALKAARSRDRARPGRWLFPPRLKSSKATRKCMRWAKRYSRKRGRYVYRCGKYETIEPVAASAAAPVKSERSIFNFASRYVSARAIDRELSLTRDSGWAANRVSQNLRGFLNQKRNPAICTGAIQFLDYFDKRLEGFAKRANSFEEMASKSRDLAQLRTSQAIDAAKVEPGGHPGWGSAPLDLPQATPGRTLKNQLEKCDG